MNAVKLTGKTASALLAVSLLATSAVSAADAEEARVIVTFAQNSSQTQVNDYIAYWQARGVSLVSRIPMINGVIMGLPAGMAAKSLTSHSIVMRIESDQAVQLRGVKAAGEGGAGEGGAGEGGAGEGGATIYFMKAPRPAEGEESWGLLRLHNQPYNPASLTGYYPGCQGLVCQARANVHNVKVAVLDTGVNSQNHTMRVTDAVSFVAGSGPQDDNGHGTHVAGILGDSRVGVAPEVEILSIKVLDSKAGGNISDVLQGIQYAVERKVDVINMSLAFKKGSPALQRAIREAYYRHNIFLVAAVGNRSNWEDDAQGASGEGGAGEGGAGEGGAGEGGAGEGGAGATAAVVKPYTVMYPARYREVFSVSALTPQGKTARFANRGDKVDAVAPGVNILSTDRGGDYAVRSGTSMAVPYISGVVALIRALNPQLTAEQITRILRETASAGEIVAGVALERSRYTH